MVFKIYLVDDKKINFKILDIFLNLRLRFIFFGLIG